MIKPLKSSNNSFHRSAMAQAFLDAGVVSDTPLIRSPKATINPKKGKKRALNVSSVPGAFGNTKKTEKTCD